MRSGWVKDGRTKHPLYSTYDNMVRRCTRPSTPSFKDYGARGITVSPEWLGPDGFAKFCEDVPARPSSAHSFDRIDNSRGYSKDNVRWATRLTQQNNNRRNRHITWNGKPYTMAELIRTLGDWEHNAVYYSRLRMGWSIERTFSTPADRRTWNIHRP